MNSIRKAAERANGADAPPSHDGARFIRHISQIDRRFRIANMPDDPALLTAAWFDAWRTKDAGAIERMMAAEYVYVAPNGAVMEREAILAIASDPSYGITDGAHTEVEVIPLGANVAVVRHRWRGHGTLRGQVFVDDHRCVMIWHRAEGLWRVRYEQASPVA